MCRRPRPNASPAPLSLTPGDKREVTDAFLLAPAPAAAVPLRASSSLLLLRRRARALPVELPRSQDVRKRRPWQPGVRSPLRPRRLPLCPAYGSLYGRRKVGRSGPSRPRRAPARRAADTDSGARVAEAGAGARAPPAARAARAPGAEQRAAAAIARGSRPRPCPGTIKLLLRAPGAGRRASPFPARPPSSSSSSSSSSPSSSGAAASGPAPGAWRSRAGWTAPRCPRAGRRKR